MHVLSRVYVIADGCIAIQYYVQCKRYYKPI